MQIRVMQLQKRVPKISSFIFFNFKEHLTEAQSSKKTMPNSRLCF